MIKSSTHIQATIEGLLTAEPITAQEIADKSGATIASVRLAITKLEHVLIRLSPKPPIGSMLSIFADVGRPWLLTFLNEGICPFRARCRSSSASSLTRQSVPLTLSEHDRTTGSFALVAERLAIPIVLLIVQLCCDAATASTIATSRLAP